MNTALLWFPVFQNRYLSTGDSFQTISFSFRVGRSTVSKIAKEICIEIWNVLQPLYLPVPTQETWKQAEKGFGERWNFPNCVGSIDVKHVKIKCPPPPKWFTFLLLQAFSLNCSASCG
jgi:hypothetical protein